MLRIALLSLVFVFGVHAVAWADCLSLPAPVVSADYLGAKKAFDAGHYTAAFKRWLSAAGRGDPIAQVALGCLYENGRGVERDYVEAAKWYREAARQGIVVAQSKLGALYKNGVGVEQNYERAAEWYRKAAEQGDAAGQTGLGSLYHLGLGLEQDYREADAEWIRSRTGFYEFSELFDEVHGA